jgi:uncharacterized protein YodC (DUF2158 family)
MPEENTIQIDVDDVVKLKSGSCLMTVERIDDRVPEVHCVWFIESSRGSGSWTGPARGIFRKGSLVKVTKVH